MKVVLDENVSNGLSEELVKIGISLLSGLPQGASDDAVFSFIVDNKVVLITRDYDFTNPVRYAVEETQGIIYIHHGNLTSKEEIKLVVNFFEKHSDSDFRGKLVTLYSDSIRIR